MRHKLKTDKQINLFGENYTDLTDNSDNRISILFRQAIPEIPSTTFGTFSIYKYPAKFIPQVIAKIW